MTDVLVTAQNKEKNIVLKSKTDNLGKATFSLVEPGMYLFSYLDMKDVANFQVPAGGKGICSKTVTYDPEKIFEEGEKCKRAGIQFASRDAQQLKGQPNVIKAVINIKEKGGAIVSNCPLVLVDCIEKIKYKGISNASGNVTFYLPVNKEYEADIDGNEALRTFKVPNVTNIEISEVFHYERTRVKELAKGDTIIQQAVTQDEGTSTHVLFTLYLNNFDGQPLANEEVYMNAENGERVYFGHTDNKGACRFMLKKGTNYIGNLKYERGICLVEAPAGSGFSTIEIGRRYRGSLAIEKMLAGRHVNENGFVVNHDETPVRKAKQPQNYLKKTENGFDVDFSSSGPVGTPTVAENKIFTQEGYYSPNFYCLQAGTGEYLWGLELGESGSSPIVYEDGVLLINTYSCTLYAIEAATGKMLWSKWLAGTIYSTPSADSSSVYVVYNNGYENPANPKQSFVAASFDLHTGKMNWVNWIDNEVIACPVVAGKEVHIASQSGNYYVFDKVSGKQLLFSDNIQAASSPTVTPDQIYLTAAINGTEHLVVLNRKTLQIQKKYPTWLTPDKISENHACYNQMNFNGSHPVVYKNKIVLITDSTKLLAFDAGSEKVIWQHAVKVHPNQIPIIANEKVMIATTTGDTNTYDIYSGIMQKSTKGKANTDGQIIANKDFTYIGSDGALSVTKTIQNSQWPQWNKDAGHNVYWK